MLLLRNITIVIAAATSSLLLGVASSSAQQCDATLAESGAGMTRLNGIEPRLFVMGNFHTNPNAGVAAGGERTKLRDLAYVSRRSIEGRDRHVLSVLLSIGNGCFMAPTRPASGLPEVVVGDKPALIAAAPLDQDEHEDIAIIDTPDIDQFTPGAKLRIFSGDGAGHFKAGAGVSVLSLQPGQQPVAMAMGRFRGGNMPMDIAIASVGASRPNLLTLLINNGSGEFTVSPPIPLGDFVPGAMVASNRFRFHENVREQDRKYDLVIKEAAESTSARKRILYLQNSGDGRFPDISDITVSGNNQGAGNADVLLAGVFQTNDTAGDLLDIVTFDTDMTLRLFVNEGFGTFKKRDAIPADPRFIFAAGAQFFGAQFDDNLLHLIAAASRAGDGKQGMLLLKNNGSGGFNDPSFRPFPDMPTLPDEVATTNLQSVAPSGSGTLQPSGPQKRLVILASLLGQFLNPRHGNERPDLAILAHHLVTEVKDGACERITLHAPLRHFLHRQARAGTGSFVPGFGMTCFNPGLVCIDHLVECDSPPTSDHKCICRCPRDDSGTPDPDPVPLTACHISKEYPPMLVVFANPFNND